VPDSATLPPAAQLASWAHVQVNRSLLANPALVQSGDAVALAAQLQSVLREDPDLACSRLVSPRRLRDNVAYHAFVVPVFETGRLAGLGLDPAHAPHATASAWVPYPAQEQPEALPYYFRWYFRTGGPGDFEQLVRQLQPRPSDHRVGRRDVDAQTPGPGLPGLDDALKLGGALRVPDALLSATEREQREREDTWFEPAPHALQRALATLINLADDYLHRGPSAAHSGSGLPPQIAGSADPVITPPLYGRWHALTQRLLRAADGTPVSPDDNWVHELNLDPRHRAAAGLGTQVVQANQEEYMNAAWQQVGDVLEANRRIRLGQLAREASRVWHQVQLVPLLAARPLRVLVLTAPVHRRVVAAGTTVLQHVRESPLSQAALSAPLRRITRPRARLARAFGLTAPAAHDELLVRLNAGEIFAAPPKQVPEGAPTVADVATLAEPSGIPAWPLALLRRFPWLPLAVLLVGVVLAAVILIVSGGSLVLVATTIAAAAIALYRWLRSLQRSLIAADALREEARTPAAVDDLPTSPDFVVSMPGAGVTPAAGATDSPEALRFKTALRDAHRMITASGELGRELVGTRLDVPRLATSVAAALDPVRTVPLRVRATLRVPDWVAEEIDDTFEDVMAYPVIDVPMYKPLIERSPELFLPNVHLVPENSITVLESNQTFIEAYMVGLNHEGVRELQWREYPTDLRGTLFRQFWDPSGYLAEAGADPDALRERLRDIPPLHQWPRRSGLGTHDQRDASGSEREEVVLVIRGELLKRYPSAVIYAQRAEWQRTAGRIDPSKARQPITLSATEQAVPPRDKVKTPLYQAKVEPDIYFLGFDLTTDDARGGSGEQETDSPGWFFMIEERAGNVRLGLDVARDGALNVWNDLTWDDVLPAGADFIPIDGSTPLRTLVQPTDQAKLTQWQEDRLLPAWNRDLSAADIPYVLFQAPVRIAVHAAEMLRQGS
jgi:hypothetical protein